MLSCTFVQSQQRNNVLLQKLSQRTFSTTSSASVGGASVALPKLPSMLTKNTKEISKSNIIPLEEYSKQRKEYYKLRSEVNTPRRVELGPNATITFESFDSVWIQIHEMLWIEKGGDRQVIEEIAAYNPLIPKGGKLPFTLMFQYPDPNKRKRMLSQLGHVENQIYLSLPKHKIQAVPVDGDTAERTTAEGKTSAVHFLQFQFTPDQIREFKSLGKYRPSISIEHPAYSHTTLLSSDMIDNLSKDLD